MLLVACLELLAFVWGYGTDRLVFDVAFMQQVALARSLVRRWRRVSPLASLVAAAVSLTAVHVYVDEMQAMERPVRFAAIAMVVLAVAAVPPLVVTWLLENNWVRLLRACAFAQHPDNMALVSDFSSDSLIFANPLRNFLARVGMTA